MLFFSLFCVFQTRPLRKGDKVLISSDVIEVINYQQYHGGWNDGMRSVRIMLGNV
jgi:hypothetical protein